MRTTRPALIVLAPLLALIVGCGGGGGGSDPEATPEATAAPASDVVQQALGRWVEATQGKQYAGDCGQAEAGRDVGKICSVAKGERGNYRAFTAGPTFAEGGNWVILDQRNGQWEVVQTTAITPDIAALPGVPWPLATGIEVFVVGGPVNVRVGPGLSQAAVDSLQDGTKLKLSAGPLVADNISWWQIEGRSGWVSADYLRYVN